MQKQNGLFCQGKRLVLSEQMARISIPNNMYCAVELHIFYKTTSVIQQNAVTLHSVFNKETKIKEQIL